MQYRNLFRILLISAPLWVSAGACSDDDVQPNPNYDTGGTGANLAGAPAAGQDGFGLGGGGDVIPSGGMPDALGGAPSAGTGGAGQPAEGGDAGAANGGAPPEQPPYDCVLHPKTHLEIINACTDATRIEKHPELPAIP